MRSISNRFFYAIVVLLNVFAAGSICAQQYRPIATWPDETNARIEEFLNTTLTDTGRKVAVFDCDGTVFGQAPYYLADEALYDYADKKYKNRKDKESRQKMAILDRMVKDGNNVGKPYVEDRVHFLSGMTPEEIATLGYDCYMRSYKGKMYPEMKTLISNLKEYGFEVWILTASPEFLYQRFVASELGIPVTHVLGVKGVVKNGVMSDEIIMPIPQDDGKAQVIPTYIKAVPLIVGGNSRGDMDMLNESRGLKIVVNPDDVTVRGKEDGPMSGHTVKSYWEKEGALIVHCNDVRDKNVSFKTADFKIRTNLENPKK